MSALNVWLIKIGEPFLMGERKLRMSLLAEKLVEKGCHVIYWVSAFDHEKKCWVFDKDKELEINAHYKIKAIKGSGYGKNFSLMRFIDHRLISRRFRKLAPKMQKPDIIVAAMTPYDLAYEAVRFAKKYNIPVLIDIRDQWPDVFIDFLPVWAKKISRILLNREFLIVKNILKEADGIISMMESFLTWGLIQAERKRTWRDRMFYLGHQRIVSLNIRSKKIVELLGKIENKFVVVFAGTFSILNNTKILIQSAKTLILEKNICFVLAGDGVKFKEVKSEAGDLTNVMLPGWLNNDEVDILLSHSHLGVYLPTKPIDCFGNKVFAYFASGLPIVCPNTGELKEVVEKYEIGFPCAYNDAEMLTNLIKKVYGDQQLRMKVSANAITAFNDMFDADKIYEEYARHIVRIAEKCDGL